MRKNLNSNRINIAKITSGTFLGQLVSIVTVPILNRIYGANIIGIFTLYVSISTVINTFTDLGLSNTIMIEEEINVEKLYNVITTLSLTLSMISSVFITIYFTFIAPQLELNMFFFCIFIFVLLFTTQQIQICYIWFNRYKKYDVIMKNPLIKNVLFSSTAIILGIMGFISYGYFIGYMIGQVCTLIYMRKYLPKYAFIFDIHYYKIFLRKHLNFIRFQMPTNIIGNLKNQLPTFLIKAFWGNEMLGYFSITLTLLGLPISLLGSAIGSVYFQFVSKLSDYAEIGKHTLNNMFKGMKLALLPMALCMAFGDVIVVVVLGSEWELGGIFMQIMAVQYFFIFLMSTIQGFEITINKQKYAMCSCIIQAIAITLGLMLGKYMFHDIRIGLAIMSITIVIIYIFYFSLLYKTIGISYRTFFIKTMLCISILILSSLSIRYITQSAGLINLIYRFT